MEIWERGTWRLSERGRRWFDILLVVALLLPVLAIVASGSSWPLWVFSLLEIAPLLWRRRRPTTVFAVVGLVSALQTLFTHTPVWGQAAFPIALYSVARYAGGRRGLAALVVGWVGAAAASWVWISGYHVADFGAYAAYTVLVGLIATVAWALGALARLRGRYVDTLEERNQTLLVEAEQREALAAQDERARIAREMHDVVAHGLSVIVVQADGARFAASQDPEIATKALGTISDAAREALTEMRRLLGLLRAEDDGTETTPQPRLADLPGLIAEARDAGTDVRATLPPEGAAVPEGVGLTAYRIVQEALSNVRKHAGPGATVSVLVAVGDDVTAEVRDDGRGAAADASDGGLGLVGMAERVAAHGGVLETGPIAGGGFRVWARIPL